MRKNVASRRNGLTVGIVVFGGLLLIAGTAQTDPSDPITVELACPTTIPAAGGPLNITLTLTNRSRVTQTVTKSGLGVHLGNLVALGPFFVPLSASIPSQQSRVVPFVSTPFPAGAASPGTFSSVGVFVMDSANKPLGSGFCVIQIQ